MLLIAGVTSGCRQQRPPTAELGSTLPPIEISKDRRLLFTYFAGDQFTTTAKFDEIPEARRHWVRVVDLATKPERRRDHELVYVADLRQPAKDKTHYRYIVLSRAAFERAARQGQPQSGDNAGGKQAGVILYSTSWCGACRAARKYLDQNRIPYVERDIEKDPAAARELMSKARAAGISPSGVPVIDVNGTLMQGFSAQRLSQLLKEKK